MLTYELYLNNKESRSAIVKKSKLLKKIYVNIGRVTIDSKALEEYGKSNEYNFLQEWLSMPLNTSDAERLNLSDKRTGSRSPSPYVKIYGRCKINKNKRHIILNIYGKDSNNIKLKRSFESELDLLDDPPTETFSIPTDQIILNIEKQRYQIGKNNLFKSYVERQRSNVK